VAFDFSQIIFQSIINSIKIAPALWLMILALLFAATAIWVFKLLHLAKADIFKIDKMSGEEFETFLEILFRNDGFKVNHTGSSNKYKGDWGADLIIEKNGIKTSVQAKRWKWMVTEKSVQEVVTSKAQYGCQGAMVITNSHFSYHAKHLARVNNVLLWDRNTLASEILRIRKQNKREQ